TPHRFIPALLPLLHKPRRGDGHQVAALELGAAAASGLWPGPGALPMVSARGAATHRRHHAERGDRQNPPPSETGCRPTPHRACPFPPSTVRLGGLSRRQRAWSRRRRARRDGVAHTAARVPSWLAIGLPRPPSPAGSPCGAPLPHAAPV